MQRSDWKFSYKASDLAVAATSKHAHHIARLSWWEKKKQEVIEEVRANGLEVSESIASQYSTSQGCGGPHIVVNNEHQKHLSEAYLKIKHHDSKVNEYAGWVQILEGNSTQSLQIDADDYLFFFGK